MNYQFRRVLVSERKERKDRRDARINAILAGQNAEGFAGHQFTRHELRMNPTLIPDFYDGEWNHHRFRDQEDPRNQRQEVNREEDEGWGRLRRLTRELADAVI